MATQGRLSKKICFAEFELDLETAELWNGESKVVLPGKPFQVLKILLEQPGELVGRQELIERLWPDGTFVDFDQSLNKAVNRLRDALNDSADTPKLIETLPRKGYRFIGALSSAPPQPGPRRSAQMVPWPQSNAQEGRPRGSVSPLVPIEKFDSPETPPPSSGIPRFPKGWVRPVLGISAGALLAGGVVCYWFLRIQPRPENQTVMLNASPFAAFAGEKSFPSFSPDGSRIAFGLNVDKKGFDLYVKAIGSESLLRLTQHPSQSISSAWSPDGTQIAFHRVDGPNSGIYLVSAMGGPERKVHTTRVVADMSRALPISWSPDGRWIAFADVIDGNVDSRISLLSTATWGSERIGSWPGCQQENSPSFSHDGKFLAFACFTGRNESAVYCWEFKRGELKKIVSLQGFVYGLAWSAGDNDLVYTLWDSGAPGLREVSIKTGAVRQLGFTGSALFPAVSAGGHLAFITTTSHYGIWRMDLRHPESPAARLVPSSTWEQDADISSDGKHIAFQSGRSGTGAIWMSDIDGSNLIQLSTPGISSGSPRWSPDGNRIAYDALPSGNWEIHVIDLVERIPRKLVTNVSSSIRPHWSNDGRWIYFRSYDQGKEGIYRCPSSGGNASRLSSDKDAFSPIESPDGRTIYFASRQWKSILMKTSVAAPGAEYAVDGIPMLRDSNAWAVVSKGIYFIPDNEPDSLFYLEFATRKVKRVVRLDKHFGLGLSVSPDQSWVAFSDYGETASNIMFVDRVQ